MQTIYINGELNMVADENDFLALVEKHMGRDAVDYICTMLKVKETEIKDLDEEIMDLSDEIADKETTIYIYKRMYEKGA